MDVLTRPDLTMVVPTYNERHRLDSLVARAEQASPAPDRTLA